MNNILKWYNNARKGKRPLSGEHDPLGGGRGAQMFQQDDIAQDAFKHSMASARNYLASTGQVRSGAANQKMLGIARSAWTNWLGEARKRYPVRRYSSSFGTSGKPYKGYRFGAGRSKPRNALATKPKKTGFDPKAGFDQFGI